MAALPTTCMSFGRHHQILPARQLNTPPSDYLAAAATTAYLMTAFCLLQRRENDNNNNGSTVANDDGPLRASGPGRVRGAVQPRLLRAPSTSVGASSGHFEHPGATESPRRLLGIRAVFVPFLLYLQQYDWRCGS